MGPNEVTHDRDKTPDEIEEEMRQTRIQLTEKVTLLEKQVLGTATAASNAITSTVSSIKSLFNGGLSGGPSMGSTKEIVGETISAVRDTVDVSGAVRANPWQSVGIAAGAGFLVGMLIGDSSRSDGPPSDRFDPAPGYVPAGSLTPPTPPRKPGIFDDVLAIFSQKAREVAETAVESLTASVKQNIRTEAPHMVDAVTNRIAGHVTGETPNVRNGYGTRVS